MIETVGPYAGMLAMVGLLVVTVLLFSQARDLRRLREWAGGAPERDAEIREVSEIVAEERSQELKVLAEREERRLEREGYGGASFWDRLGRPGRVMAIIAAVLVVGAGAAYAGTTLLGGDDSSTKAGNNNGGGCVETQQIPPGVMGLIPDGDVTCSWRWMGPVYEDSTQDILNNSIVVRNLQELGVDSIEALKYLFPSKTDEERAEMLSGFPFRMVNELQGAYSQFARLVGGMMQTPHPQAPDLPMAADPRLDLTPYLYRTLEALQKEMSYAGRYRPIDPTDEPSHQQRWLQAATWWQHPQLQQPARLQWQPVQYQVGTSYPQAVPQAAPSYQSAPTQYAPQSPSETPRAIHGNRRSTRW